MCGSSITAREWLGKPVVYFRLGRGIERTMVQRRQAVGSGRQGERSLVLRGPVLKANVSQSCFEIIDWADVRLESHLSLHILVLLDRKVCWNEV